MVISGLPVVKVFPHKTERYWSCAFNGPHSGDYEDGTPCSLVDRYQRFEWICCLHLHRRRVGRVFKEEWYGTGVVCEPIQAYFFSYWFAQGTGPRSPYNRTIFSTLGLVFSLMMGAASSSETPVTTFLPGHTLSHVRIRHSSNKNTLLERRMLQTVRLVSHSDVIQLHMTTGSTHPGACWTPSPKTTCSQAASTKRKGQRDTRIRKRFIGNKHCFVAVFQECDTTLTAYSQR
jgi:hypothetical protein